MRAQHMLKQKFHLRRHNGVPSCLRPAIHLSCFAFCECFLSLVQNTALMRNVKKVLQNTPLYIFRFLHILR